MGQVVIPIACDLSDSQLRERREAILNEAADKMLDFRELENGFSYRFPMEDSVLESIVKIINLERKCCPFLNFAINIESGKDSFALELTGADGAKEAIISLFEWNPK